MGTGRVATYKIDYRPFKKARFFARSLKLRTRTEWNEYSKTQGLPPDIPTAADNVYRDDGWISWPDWLGSDVLGPQDRKKLFWDFEKARAFVHKLELKSLREWQAYSASGNRPVYIPSTPSVVYKDAGWIGMADWCGYGQ